MAMHSPACAEVRTLNGISTVETLGSADPGTNGTATLCSNGAAVQFQFDSLNGTPDAGGTWSGPAAHPGTFDPATDAPGAFTYTVGLSSATVTVTVHGLPSAGTAGTLISCINGPAVDLFTRLAIRRTSAARGPWRETR